MTFTQDARLRLFPAIMLLVFVANAHGDTATAIQWRIDYNAVRKEATEKGRPILIDFGAENCLWCKKLDLTTFRDPTVVKLLNEGFVALRVDADRETTLVQTLRITQYPTMVLASPEGKIIGVLEGYQDSATLSEQLQRVAAYYGTPEWMTRDYQEATRAIMACEYGRAITLLKNVAQDGRDRNVQVQARQVMRDLEQQAAARLIRAKSFLDRGQSSEAAENLTELLHKFGGTQASSDAVGLLASLAAKPEMRDQQRQRRARELLALAKDDFRTQQYVVCLDRCETLTTSYSDLAEGQEALQLAAEIKDKPELMAKACDGLNQRLGTMYLTLAETWMKKGQPAQAQQCLEKVLQTVPGSGIAEFAQVRLAKIQGTATTQQAEYKKR